MIFEEEIKKAFDSLNIEITNEQVEKFKNLSELLTEWNNRFNLTSIIEEYDVIYKHYLDSVSVLKHVNIEKDSKIIDVGTGAGFPGLPIKIMRPDLKIVFLDSVNKKLNFVREAITQLSLENTEVIHMRAEDAGNDRKYREKFDVCLSRAVANLSTLSELCVPLVKKNGCFISYKGGNIDDELEEAKHGIKLLGGKILKTVEFTIPDADLERTFVIISKEKATPSKYPRKAGTPSKSPL